MTESDKRELALKDFNKSSENYIKLNNLIREEEDKFLKIKLGFIGILGVIYTVGQDHPENFESYFTNNLIIILVAAILLLIFDLWRSQIAAKKDLKKQLRITVLKKIRYISLLDKSLEKYGFEAEKLLINDDKFLNLMKKNKLITSMIEIKTNEFYSSLFLWSLIFMSLPMLFFLNSNFKI